MTARGDGTRVVHSAPTSEGEPFLAGPVFAAPYHLGGADTYGRAHNPTWRALEAALGELDGGECVLFPSGMAAISTLLRVVLSPGDTVVVPSDGYYLTRTLLAEMPVRVLEAPTAGPYPPFDGVRLVLLESPSNPGLDVCDIAELSARAHAAGALVAVDNTTATPLGQKPLELGADVVLSSDTKAVSGHSDLVLGHMSTADVELAERVRTARTTSGAIPGPFEAWLAHRGLGTLDLRLARQAQNAAALYRALREHPAVTGLRWPGAPEDPAHEVASRQMRRFGGVLTFVLADEAAVAEFLARSRLVAASTSFGGLHTSADRRAQWGDPVPEGLVRLSAGCEDTEDLVADVLAALA
ncbi:cystathionine gamma-lyase [Saccharothrix coeruleofusca]|uniref:Cystathionine gamma-lyase n=1 Tax=Saccharothrix coeruleofusca TaxID=33919 RepID=A0A918AK32_9PSEU|nr:cystathionine gamma-lyase [Saccharothrix coeruleofusca]MBP2338605.1 cystathionine gamma-lyase [Saccharothrix coeruleofusca]GGP47255.1 cystathionine gamma-lyase [Saccharothrix coeruleofusca]